MSPLAYLWIAGGVAMRITGLALWYDHRKNGGPK